MLIPALLLATTQLAWGKETIQDHAVTAGAASPQEQHDKHWGGGKTIGGTEAPGYVTFTFDDGPDLETTPQVIRALEEHGVPATFFVVGRRFAKHGPKSAAGAELLLEMARRGFLIGNHTSEHKHLRRLEHAKALLSIAGNAADLEKVLGYQPRLFRAPFGATTAKIRQLLRKRQDTVVRWNIDPQDFQRGKQKTLRQRVVNSIFERGGGVVLLHDTKKATARALPGILEDLRQANCQRIAQDQKPIVPVSLHYFMRDPNGDARPIPAEVLKDTQRTLENLIESCQKDN
jgi:peptidoglycan/xylan/chitin deacetylase (PgdA/CDA1 family)